MIKLLSDEDYNNDILRGVLRRLPGVDIVRVQDVGLMNVHDRKVLEWAAQENRIVLTHDVNTLVMEAHRRVTEGLPLPGVLASPQMMSVGPVIRDLVFVIENSQEDEWKNQVVFLPI